MNNIQIIRIKRDNRLQLLPMVRQYALKSFMGFCDKFEEKSKAKYFV